MKESKREGVRFLPPGWGKVRMGVRGWGGGFGSGRRGNEGGDWRFVGARFLRRAGDGASQNDVGGDEGEGSAPILVFPRGAGKKGEGEGSAPILIFPRGAGKKGEGGGEERDKRGAPPS